MLLNLNFPHIPPAIGMQKLSRSIDTGLDELLFKNVRLPELPPRDITTILNLAEAGLDSEISVLEWIALLDGKEQWDSKHFNQEHSSNALIWKTACKKHGLRYLLYWRFALHLDGQDVSFPKGMIRQFAHFQKQLAEVDKQRTLLILGIYSGDISKLCHSALSFRMLPVHVLTKCGLPGQVKHSQKALKELARYWIKNTKEFDIDALFEVVNKLKNIDKDTFFTSALVDIPFAELEQQQNFVKRIVSIYSPYVKESRFGKLSHPAQLVIRELIGAMSFGDFSKLIAKLTEPVVANKLGLEDWDVRQLNSRVAFWSNYQAKFLSFAVYLPSPTYTLLKQLNFYIDDLLFHQLSNSSCEVCVLEFDNYFVLEFLRGGSSCVRIIDKNIQAAEVLKNVGSISSQQELETIPYLVEHDHLRYWQQSCEKLLRTIFNLTPNKNLKKFLITPKDKNGHPYYKEYSSVNGLPRLTAAQLSEREESLSNKRKASKLNADKSKATYLTNEVVKVLIKFFSTDKTSSLWFGHNKNYGWLIEVGRLDLDLELYCLNNRTSIKVSKDELNCSLYMRVDDYLNSIEKNSELKEVCLSLLSVVNNIPIPTVRTALVNEISKAKNQAIPLKRIEK